MTQPHGHYEIGAFDASSGSIEEMPLAKYLKLLAQDPDATHACLNEKGWWQVSERCLYNIDTGYKEVEVLEDRIMPLPEEIEIEERDHINQ